MAVMTTRSIKHLWARDLDEFFVDGFMRHPEEFPGCGIEASDAPDNFHYVKKALAATLGAAQSLGETEPVPFDAYTDGPEKLVYYSRVALALQASKLALDDDRKKVLQDATEELGKSLAYTRELMAANILDAAFVTTTRVGVDGAALVSTSHQQYGLPTGTYQSNSTSGTLTKSNLEAMLNQARKLQNEKGIPIPARPRILVVPPDQYFTAKILIQSEYDPETANNAVNTVFGENLQFVVNHYLQSTTACFLIDPDLVHLDLVFRERAAFDADEDWNTDNRKWKGTMRLLNDFWYWRGIWGLTGS